MARKLFRFSGSCVHLSGLLVVYINGAFWLMALWVYLAVPLL